MREMKSCGTDSCHGQLEFESRLRQLNVHGWMVWLTFHDVHSINYHNSSGHKIMICVRRTSVVTYNVEEGESRGWWLG